MLSVTVLPTIYSKLLNINPIWMYKILFPTMFSLVPLGLYQIWQMYIGKKYAFISSLLFMAQSTFYTEMLGLSKQMIAELFFVLLLLVMLNKRMKPFNKAVCFMIFSFALVTSHYALAEIFLLFVSVTTIFLIILKHPSRNITPSMVAFFFAIMFAWYIYTSRSATLNSFMEFADYVYRQLGEFFDPASRGQTVLRGLGMEAPPSIWNAIGRMFAYLTQAFIVAGFVGLITGRVKIHLDTEYFLLSSLASAFLIALIVVPGLANTLNMTRFYHILLFFLAPFCALGVDTAVSLVSKKKTEVKASIPLLVLLVPYFLFQTGFMYEVTQSDAWSVPLSKNRMDPIRLYGQFGYTDAYNVFGARWLSNHIVVGHTPIYACSYSRSDLRGYGLIYMGYIEILSNTTEIAANGVVYMRSLNVIEGIVVGGRRSWNTSELTFLHDLSSIYSNGRSVINMNVDS